jgi:hypothetical protein
VSWKWLIADRGGLVNIILNWLGIGPIYFLSDSGWAIVAVIVIKIWRSFPFMMLSLLAALRDRCRVEHADRNRSGIPGWICDVAPPGSNSGHLQSGVADRSDVSINIGNYSAVYLFPKA